ncbi:unnamed protein product [Larinioides sclopetarius]|uniref:Uncharacterized protein n=1 Tax=Larinioides sclopetarius TaxID=280406 RepID=A0AAV1ZYA8_9ARAC
MSESLSEKLTSVPRSILNKVYISVFKFISHVIFALEPLLERQIYHLCGRLNTGRIATSMPESLSEKLSSVPRSIYLSGSSLAM